VMCAAASAEPHLHLPQRFGTVLDEDRSADALSHHALEGDVAPTDVRSVDACVVDPMLDESRDGDAHSEQATAFGAELRLNLLDGLHRLLDGHIGVVTLWMQADFGDAGDPQPQVEAFHADAGLADLHADDGAELRVHLEHDPGPAPVGLLEADLGNQALLQQGRREVRDAGAAQTRELPEVDSVEGPFEEQGPQHDAAVHTPQVAYYGLASHGQQVAPSKLFSHLNLERTPLMGIVYYLGTRPVGPAPSLSWRLTC